MHSLVDADGEMIDNCSNRKCSGLCYVGHGLCWVRSGPRQITMTMTMKHAILEDDNIWLLVDGDDGNHVAPVFL